MKTILPVFFAVAVAAFTIAATSKPPQRLTVRRVAELTAPADTPQARSYTVQISGLDFPPANARSNQQRLIPDLGFRPASPASPRVTLAAEKPQGLIEVIREFRYPVDFDPPGTSPGPDPALTKPITPRGFDSTNTGWTIRLTARPAGRFIALSGTAEYVEVEMVQGGYGPLSSPIVDDQNRLVSPNVAHQPKIQTTTTRFHIFALPGEPSEVVLYKGKKAGKHTVTVAVD